MGLYGFQPFLNHHLKQLQPAVFWGVSTSLAFSEFLIFSSLIFQSDIQLDLGLSSDWAILIHAYAFIPNIQLKLLFYAKGCCPALFLELL